ncbi:MAG: FtsH protease activity modulator HflK [Robiginitomaculum sp.]|nr:FtsH protease activity modulator HflK [Robiginitomaculum sp.]MDQ7077940.1 FtsH protease activity modulator HflK [Robiginitomaculum sp.]
MPWNDQSNGNGSRGQKPGDNGKSPWGNSPQGGGEPPEVDVDEIVRNLQRRFGGIFGGGNGGNGRGRGGKGLGGLGIGVIVIVLIGVWFFTPGSGWYIVKAEEQGVVLRFGAYNRTELPGFHWKLPVPFETALKPKVARVHQENIGFRVSRGRNTSSSIPHESLMLTGDENIVDINFSVIWQIKNARDFLFNLDDPVGAVKAVSESAMREVVGKNDLEPIITQGRQIVETTTRELIQKALDEYGAGVIITQVQLQKADPPSRVLEAFRDVVNAGQDAETKVNQATAYANDVVPKARGDAAKLEQEAIGYRDSVIAEAAGEAERFNLIYKEYKKAPVVTRQRMYLETMERVLRGTDKVLLDKNAGNQVVPYLPIDPKRSNTQGGR